MKTNILKNRYKKAVLVTLAASCLTITPANAQNATYAPGDLILYFQQFGGAQTVMVNLGLAATYRDATSNILNIANIAGTLTGSVGSGGAGFSATWYDDPSIYWGLAAVRSTAATAGTPVNGDPSRTLYVSQERTAVGNTGEASSIGYSNGGSPLFSSTDMGTGASGIFQMTNRMETVATTTTFVEPTTSSFVNVQNPFLGSNPGTAYGIFPGGVEGKFGPGSLGTLGGVNAEAALDYYRILAFTTAPGQVGGPLREGTYEGTFLIDQAGSVSYIAQVPEPATIGLLASCVVFGLVRRRRMSRA